MKIKIELTEDIITTLSHIEPKQLDDNLFGVNTQDLFHSGYVKEQIAAAIGRYDERDEDTANEIGGYVFPEATEDYIWDIYEYIRDNMFWIHSIIFAFMKDGVKPGVYTCIDRVKVWTYKPFEK